MYLGQRITGRSKPIIALHKRYRLSKKSVFEWPSRHIFGPQANQNYWPEKKCWLAKEIFGLAVVEMFWSTCPQKESAYPAKFCLDRAFKFNLLCKLSISWAENGWKKKFQDSGKSICCFSNLEKDKLDKK